MWSNECEGAFQRLKRLLMRAPILAYPNFSRDFLLETDASGMGLGAVLSQSQGDKTIRPIAFASRTLHPHRSRNYAISELEALGVVWAVRHFRHYLYGHQLHRPRGTKVSYQQSTPLWQASTMGGWPYKNLTSRLNTGLGKRMGKQTHSRDIPSQLNPTGQQETVPVLVSSIQKEIQSGEETEIQSGEETEI